MRITIEAMLDALLAADDATATRLLRDMGHELLPKPNLAAALVAVALDPADGPECGAAAALLATALDEARMAARNEVPEGRALLDGVEAAVDATLGAESTTPGARLRVAQIYARAGLPTPASAILSMPALLAAREALDDEGDAGGPVEDPAEGARDIGPILEDLERETDGNAYLAYVTLAEQFAAFPDEMRALLVAGIAERDETFSSRVASYFLLDPSGFARVAAAAAFRQRAEAGRLDAETSAALVSVRTWLGADPARAHLDAAIRSTMRRAGGATSASADWTVERVLATIPDGAGAQSIAVATKAGRRRAVLMLLLKQSYGIADAFLVRCGSAAERDRILRELKAQVEAFEVDAGYPREALRRALGEASDLGLSPPPGLIDALRIWPGDILTPASVTTEDLCEAVEADRLEAFDEVPEVALASLEAWFEDTADLRAALARARSDRARETIVARRLEDRRDWWARQCAIAAATLATARGGRRRAADFFAASARALLDGEAISEITVGQIVAAQTLDADDDRADNVDAFLEGTCGDVAFGDGPDADGPDDIAAWLATSAGIADLSEILAAGGISEPFVDGFLAACMLAPVPRHPSDWLADLVETLPVESPAEAERVVAHVLSRLELFFGESAASTALAARLEVASDDEFTAFAEGFSSAAADRKSWPKRVRNARDKRVLQTLESCRRGADPATIGATRELLAPWLTRLAERGR